MDSFKIEDSGASSLMATTAGDTRLTAEVSRARQTERPATPFRDVLAASTSVLMSGAAVATHVVAGPILAAAVHSAGQSAATAIVGTPPAGTGGAAVAGLATAAASAPGSDMATMQAMQRESQAFNMQLLALQEEVQQENRHFTTMSNVLRAKHDTAKAAVSNIRS